MEQMNNDLANYVLKLRDAAGATQRAEDRPIYERLLADAGIILALVQTDASPDVVADAVASHERLWGHIWLQDPVFEKPSNAWQKIKKQLSG
jgi:hypothetical protein